jgi:hypothetical protein
VPKPNGLTRELRVAYAVDTVILLGVIGTLVAIVHQPATAASAHDLIRPVIALVLLTGVVWLLMGLVRNAAVIRGAATLRYFQTYTAEAPAEWIERPARTFMNLLEVPILFYVVVLLMLQTQRFDATQAALSWFFVVTRFVHAAVYITLNYVPLRFVCYLAGCITLGVIWTRFATQIW